LLQTLADIVPLRRGPLEQPTTGKSLVFVIDDEPSVLKGLRLVIEDWGYTVLRACTELEAISILNGRKQAPDIIIAYSAEVGRRFRAKSATCSNRSRPGIPLKSAGVASSAG
jgi:exosortase/archaeosortase